MKRVFAVILAAGSVVGCRQTPAEPAPLPPVVPAPVEQTPPPTTAPAQSAKPVETPLPPVVVTPPPAPVAVAPAQPEPLATIDGVSVSREQVVDRLMEAQGLNMLLRVLQMEMAKSAAAKAGVVASETEILAERNLTLERMTRDVTEKLRDDIEAARNKNDVQRLAKLEAELKSDQEALLQQMLAQENMSKGEFDLLMEANANMRKVVDKELAGKITPENLLQAFNTIYGEKVRIKHIQLSNMSEVAEAQRRLEAGESFSAVAKAMSRNPSTAAAGGDFPPFSRETTGLPDGFKQVAFDLREPGEVSQAVEANGSYHLITLVRRIPPTAVKFEDVKDAVEKQLHDRWVDQRMRQYREMLAKNAMKELKISDPVLARQFRDRALKRENQIHEREQVLRELEREREAMTRQSATQPAGPSQTAPIVPIVPMTTMPAMSEEGTLPISEQLRPPATGSGSDTPDQPASVPATQKN